jgi:hypothetical protein
MKWLFRRYIERGRDEMLSEVITKFESAYDHYYGLGEFKSADLVTDFVAWLQDDEGGLSDPSI